MIGYRLIPLIAVLLLGLGSAAWAGQPTDQLRAYTDQVLKVLKNPALSLPERREAVRHLAGEVFEVSETARRALGPHWLQRTPAERELEEAGSVRAVPRRAASAGSMNANVSAPIPSCAAK